MNAQEWIELEQNVLLHTYSRPDFIASHGEGVYLVDTDGHRYLDCVSGIAVNALGYGYPAVVDALTKQGKKLWHCSNLYFTTPQIQLAKRLTDLTFADKVFFTNSGTEAIEGAIKFARKWGRQNDRDRFEIISFHHSFHGRSYGALSATGQSKFWADFGPMLPGFRFAEYNDIESVKNAITDQTCAILVEPIQGESGVLPADPAFLQECRTVADEHDLLLILDEIQCGLSRTGWFCAHETSSVTPDIMTIAKPLAGGLPLGAVLLTDRVAHLIAPGQHGTTFGGGPLTCHIADTIVQTLSSPECLHHVRRMGERFKEGFLSLQQHNTQIQEVRGRGLMLGVQMEADPTDLIDICRQNGLLVCKAGRNTIRFLPALIIGESEVDAALDLFGQSLKESGQQ